MFWLSFYKIFQKTKGRIDLADPKEIQSATRECTIQGASPSEAYVRAWQEYVKDPTMQL